MNRRIIYRRILLFVLAASMLFAIFFLNRYPPFPIPQETNVPQKSVSASASERTLLYPCGFQVGIYLQTKGVMIIGTDQVTTGSGVNYSPAYQKVQAGDYITKLNDIDVSSKNQLTFLVNKYGSDDLILTILRNGKKIKVRITPVCTGENEYKLGIWVRDDTQGIGTMTYLTEDGNYGSLGHGISDIDTGELLKSEGGLLYEANVWGIKRGQAGYPGALYGMISYETGKRYGAIDANTEIGIYGNLAKDKKAEALIKAYALTPVETAATKDIKAGKAYLHSYVSGEACDYEIEIEKIDKERTDNKGLIFKVTDERLLSLTGGIVQGMSGTPILQDGKIVGAVTHVFVNDPTRGYGIFIETMLAH